MQFRAGCSRVHTLSTTLKGLDLLFANILENLPVPNISNDVSAWNKLYESYYECLLHLGNLTSIIMVSMFLPILHVPLFLGLF